jgi:hypothetical protein
MQELPHAGAAESHAGAEGLILAELEVGDGLFRKGDGRLLSGDLGDLGHGVIDGHLAVRGFAHARGDDDFLKPRDLVRVGVAELLGEARDNLVFVVLQ